MPAKGAKNMKTPKAYSYIRFSTPEQIKGDSLRRQTELSEQYAAKHNLQLDTTLSLRDLGLSAYDKSNITKGALGQFLRLVEEKTIPKGSYLLVESLDRLSRAQVMDALHVFMGILKAGIKIVTLADEALYSWETTNDNWASLIMSIVIMSRATEESAMKSRRVRAAWDAKRANVGNKILTKRCPQWIKPLPDRTGFELIPEHAEVVRWIFEQAKAGIGSYTIVRQLNQKGIKPFGTAKSWGMSSVEKILHSPTTYGEFQPHLQREGKIEAFGEPIPDYYPAVVRKEDFLALRQLRTSRRTAGGSRKGATLSNLFSGMLKCGYCGETMQMSGYVGKRSDNGGVRTSKYVVCHGAKKGLGCHFIQWGYNDLEETVLNFCREVDIDALLNPSTAQKKAIHDLEVLVTAKSATLEESRTKQQRLIEAIESGDAPAGVMNRISQLDTDIERLAQEIAETQKTLEYMHAEVADMTNQRQSIMELYETMRGLSDDDLYRLRVSLSERIRRVFTRIDLYPGGLWYTKAALGKIKAAMQERKLPADRIKEVISAQPSEPDKRHRSMVITLRSGVRRLVGGGVVYDYDTQELLGFYDVKPSKPSRKKES